MAWKIEFERAAARELAKVDSQAAAAFFASFATGSLPSMILVRSVRR
jgi:hypothetical protein